MKRQQVFAMKFQKDNTRSYMKQFFLGIASVFFVFNATIIAQDINKTWHFESIQNNTGEDVIPVNINNDGLELNNGEFNLSLEGKNNLKASGEYMYQNKLLILYYNEPNDTIQKYKITELTDSTLVFLEKTTTYKFKTPKNTEESKAPITSLNTITPSQGFSLNSLLRGALGMLALLLISFILSKNRKAINWKTIGFGLTAQLFLAIGVLKINFIQNIFGFIGKLFVKTLDFTRAGSEFLLGGMMNIESFGFIFLFQVLPTIIFFSALTSLLFYLGVIQKVVKGMAWVLTKLLGISGAESLSVAGNI